MNAIERRDFLKGSATGVFAFTVGGVDVLLSAREAHAQNIPFRLLKTNEAETIEALGETPGERCRATSSNSRPSASVRLSQATGSPSCGLRVRRQVLMRTMTASSRELQAASTASLADSARLATCG